MAQLQFCRIAGLYFTLADGMHGVKVAPARPLVTTWSPPYAPLFLLFFCWIVARYVVLKVPVKRAAADRDVQYCNPWLICDYNPIAEQQERDDVESWQDPVPCVHLRLQSSALIAQDDADYEQERAK